MSASNQANIAMKDFAQLEQAVEAFCRFIEDLPEEALAEQAWGAKEVLAHLVYWHEVYVSQAQCLLSGEPVPILQGRYRDLNALAVERSRGVPVAELVRRFRAANRTLGEILLECDPQQVIIPIKTGVRSYTLTRLIAEVHAHVRGHLQKLKREWRKSELRNR
jgi:hypothetical protein